MRWLLCLIAAGAVIGSGYWAYRENYATQAALDDVEDLQRRIGATEERLAVLRAEWAYLNRPDRLRDLAELNFERLELGPLRPDQFGRLDQIAYPAPPKLDLSAPIEISSDGANR